MKRGRAYTLIILTAVLSATNYYIFVFPNSFTPTGVDGLCTLLQHLLGVNIGYLALLANLPLLLIGRTVLSRDFILKSALYTLSFSLASILLRAGIPPLPVYHTETGTSTVLAPLAAGVIRGLLLELTLRAGGSSGGLDIPAAMVQKKKPHKDLLSTVFLFNLGIAILSFFVYGYRFEPAICSILYAFLTSFVSGAVRNSRREGVRVEIITRAPDTLCTEITGRLHLPATVIDAHGAYADTDVKMVVCMLSKEQLPRLEMLLGEHPDALAYESTVSRPLHG